ncbi:hypothetical protein OY671_011781, partial [Metschnikowia pulcherrima]
PPPGSVPRGHGRDPAQCSAGAGRARPRHASVADLAGGPDGRLPGPDRAGLGHAAQADAQRHAGRRGSAHRSGSAHRHGRFAGRGHPRARPGGPPGLRQQDHGRHGGARAGRAGGAAAAHALSGARGDGPEHDAPPAQHGRQGAAGRLRVASAAPRRPH